MSAPDARAIPKDVQGRAGGDGHEPLDQSAIIGAVREDVRQTLRSGWIDPALESAAGQPVFFTAAWSAIRPNVGRSFLLLARALRTEATELLSSSRPAPDLRKRLDGELGEEELRRVEEAIRAAHAVTPKVQLVVHALLRAARRERMPGTGREEPPVRRGVPEWQRWMSFQPAPEDAWPVLEQATTVLGLPGPPATLRLLARWPAALTGLWDELGPRAATNGWAPAAHRLRRTVLAGIGSLPHAMELQWMALKERGFTEEARAELVEALAAHDAAMAHHTLIAAFAWQAFGSPEVGVEG
jgi:hypothetical protein